MPPSPPLLDCPTMEMPKKLTVSMLRVTVMMFKDMVESVMEEMEEVRDMAGCRRWRRCFFRLCRACSLDTLLLPGVEKDMF